MTYIKVEQSHTDDARWVEAGADAFALHMAALVYSDRQLLDGLVPRAMAKRISPRRTRRARPGRCRGAGRSRVLDRGRHRLRHQQLRGPRLPRQADPEDA